MPQHFPCGQTRRESLWTMGAGFTGTALTGLLASDGFFNRPAAAAGSSRAANPLAPRDGHFPGRAKACIFLMMNGAPSQVDTFDFKPELVKSAGKQMPADRKFINSGG
ncbi:MAG: DUF1501 domain-containing protein, partial [Fuerstiella sp.]